VLVVVIVMPDKYFVMGIVIFTDGQFVVEIVIGLNVVEIVVVKKILKNIRK
jgi:hypothetical protein